MSLPLLPTSLVGSYAQPEWLIDRAKLAGRFPPRTRQKELWRIPEEYLEEGVRAGTLKPSQDPRARARFLGMNNGGGFIEVQGTGENGGTYSRKELDQLLDLATTGIRKLIRLQRAVLA